MMCTVKYRPRLPVESWYFTLMLVGALLMMGCSTSRPDRTSSIPAAVQTILQRAESQLGVRYCYGGTTSDCFDCSGLVQYAFGTTFGALPRSSLELSLTGVAIDSDDLRPGDLVFFVTSGRDINHVGIMVDAQRFIHASTRKGVIVSALSETYWKTSYVKARRILER